PEEMPLIARCSLPPIGSLDRPAWDVEDTVTLAVQLRERGVDLIDVSTGGNVHADIPVGPEYQVDCATKVREAGLPVSAVGLITEPQHAEEILAAHRADVIEVGRAALKDPYWPRRAAEELGSTVGGAPLLVAAPGDWGLMFRRY
ncbi:hypothetical protein HT105_21425, partial [Bacteroides fragilis]|nr:hypothetical protein [Bacteroides fragilis]